jgi:hypothetical protein
LRGLVAPPLAMARDAVTTMLATADRVLRLAAIEPGFEVAKLGVSAA